jgi:hypothetical protein
MPKEDAIQQDVSEEVVEEIIEEEEVIEEDDSKPIHPRDQALQGILARRKDQLENDGVQLEGEEEAEDSKEGEEKEQEEEEKQEDLLTAKVNGEEEVLTKEELQKRLAEYQKHKAADTRLQEASDMIKKAEEDQKKLKELEESLKVKIKDGTGEDKDSSTIDINIDEIVTAIRDGGDEDAKVAMEKLIKGMKPEAPNVDEVVAEAIRKEREKQEQIAQEELEEARKTEAIEAEEKFNTTFSKEIESNKDFFDAAILQDALLDKDPEWKDRSFKDRFNEAGDRAKKLLGLDIDLRKEKVKKKKKISNLKSATARDKIGEDKNPPTRADSIAWIANRRGQRQVG